ncbi:MAG: LysR family transcriptional regulator [Hyphomicrobiaceae bacterium]|nr:LysR family transcriptional regulator [Hyphomicrobiaceae bacterium]
MEMHQIRYFLAVEKLRNFSRAAEFSHVTQPALTRAIQKLEEEIGGKLFIRRPGQIELTELGRAVLPRLEAAYREVDLARSEAASLLRNKKHRLRLSVMCTIGPDRLVSLLAQVASAVPHLEMTMTEAKGTEVLSALMHDDVDLALIGLPAYPDVCQAVPLYQERYVVAIPGDHRLVDANAIAISDLDGEDYIERINCEFDDHFEFKNGEWPVDLNTRFRSAREDWVQGMVRAGLGVAIIPESFQLVAGVTTKPLIAPDVSRSISAVSVKDRAQPAAVKSLLEALTAGRWGSDLPGTTARSA